MKRPSGPLVPAIAVAAVIIIAAIVIVATRGAGSPAGGNTTASGVTPTTSTSVPAHAGAQDNAAQRQAAARLAGLLGQSGSDRGAVDNAVVSTQSCKALSADQQVFSRAAGNRHNLLTKLGNLSGRTALSQTMLQDLTGAWQASAQADSDLAKWAGAESGHCHRGKTGNNPSLRASYGPDSRATTNKKAFTRLWNPLARKYSLRTYQWAQI
jgi:hypothetical protein